jgi:hypothetical protein
VSDWDYVVCDRCGYLWMIDETNPDPDECRYCQHDALWRFPTYQPAADHSLTVRTLRQEQDA